MLRTEPVSLQGNLTPLRRFLMMLSSMGYPLFGMEIETYTHRRTTKSYWMTEEMMTTGLRLKGLLRCRT